VKVSIVTPHVEGVKCADPKAARPSTGADQDFGLMFHR
jgi:hypothetical protein